MKKNKLYIKFHNPNTEEETIKHISLLLADVTVTKAVKLQELNITAQAV